jgi:hypothetical protein
MAAELAELGAALGASLADLSRVVREDVQPDPAVLQRLSAALDASGAKLLDLRGQHVISGYDLDEVLNFYSFYNALRAAAREVRAECARRAAAAPA